MKISVWDGGLSESYLKQVTQLGADCIDFGNGGSFPGVKEQGYPDLDELLKMRKLIRSYGLDINRVTLPNITESS
jgi:mannonate dehydratase